MKKIIFTIAFILTVNPLHANETTISASAVANAGISVSAGASGAAACPYSKLETDDGTNRLNETGIEPVDTYPEVSSSRSYEWGTLYIHSKLLSRTPQRVKLELEYKCKGSTQKKQLSMNSRFCGYSQLSIDEKTMRSSNTTAVNAWITNPWCNIDDSAAQKGNIVISVLENEQTGAVANAGRCINSKDLEFKIDCSTAVPATATEARQARPAKAN